MQSPYLEQVDIPILYNLLHTFKMKSTDEVPEITDFTMLVFDDVDSIVGVDERVYGPFRPQDLVVLPKINAKIFVKNHKARFVKI